MIAQARQIPERTATMVVFYLDFDGVVTTDRYRDLMGQSLNPFLVAAVVDLVRAVDGRVVVSSTWRRDDDCRDKLAQAGFPLDLLHPDWRTPLGGQTEVDFATGDVVPAYALTRGQEVDLHVRANEVTRYVVLDDDTAMLDHQRPWHVATDPKKGFGPADAARVRHLTAVLLAAA
jgi:hypothetical protein